MIMYTYFLFELIKHAYNRGKGDFFFILLLNVFNEYAGNRNTAG